MPDSFGSIPTWSDVLPGDAALSQESAASAKMSSDTRIRMIGVQYMEPRSVVTRAMLLDAPRKPLRLGETTLDPSEDRILIRVRACGVCRTDLHVRDGDLAPSKLPITLGHE